MIILQQCTPQNLGRILKFCKHKSDESEHELTLKKHRTEHSKGWLDPYTTQHENELTYLVEGYNVTALDILIRGFNSQLFLNKVVHRNQVVHNGKHNLQFLYTISNWYKFGCNKTIKIRLFQNNITLISDVCLTSNKS